MRRFLFFLVLLIGFVSGSVTFGLAQDDYKVGEADVLQITVYNHDDLKTTARVSRDGSITFPLIGRVEVLGLAIGQIEQKIAALLAAGYIVNPQVHIFIDDFRSRVFYVTGEVKKPDAYKYEDDTTLIKAITVAGGFSDIAAKSRVKILRKNHDGQEIIIERAKLDEAILPNDVIVVPESFF